MIRHSNDLNSVTAWANEMQSLDYNPILLFKQQRLSQPEDCNNFSDGDFILCIQTQFQWDMLIKFGNDTICMDATHMEPISMIFNSLLYL